MGNYTEETAKNIPNVLIVSELLKAQSNNIAKPNKDVSIIGAEITRRLTALESEKK